MFASLLLRKSHIFLTEFIWGWVSWLSVCVCKIALGAFASSLVLPTLNLRFPENSIVYSHYYMLCPHSPNASLHCIIYISRCNYFPNNVQCIYRSTSLLYRLPSRLTASLTISSSAHSISLSVLILFENAFSGIFVLPAESRAYYAGAP